MRSLWPDYASFKNRNQHTRYMPHVPSSCVHNLAFSPKCFWFLRQWTTVVLQILRSRNRNGSLEFMLMECFITITQKLSVAFQASRICSQVIITFSMVASRTRF